MTITLYGIKNCSMIKRPVLEYGKRLLVGFTPEVYEQVVREHV
jgi:arsenate reductase-like glutaredoxin family protein